MSDDEARAPDFAMLSSSAPSRVPGRRVPASASAHRISAQNAAASSSVQMRTAVACGSRASAPNSGSAAAGPTYGSNSSREASTRGIVRSTRHTARDHGSPPAFHVAPAA